MAVPCSGYFLFLLEFVTMFAVEEVVNLPHQEAADE